jgi:hypothetical protein
MNRWLIGQDPYQQLISDNELMVDMVVLINKELYILQLRPKDRA